MALQDPEADRLLGGMSEERKLASAHVVTEAGAVYSGGEALAPLLRVLPGGAPLSTVARALSTPLDAGYRLIVRYRGALGRTLRAGPKDRASVRIDRHAAESRRR